MRVSRQDDKLLTTLTSCPPSPGPSVSLAGGAVRAGRRACSLIKAHVIAPPDWRRIGAASVWRSDAGSMQVARVATAHLGRSACWFGWGARRSVRSSIVVRGRHEPIVRPVLTSRTAAGNRLDRSRTSGLSRLQHRDRARTGLAGTRRSVRHGDLLRGRRGIVSGYRADAAGQTEPVLVSPRNDAAEAWGLQLLQVDAVRVCAALEADSGLPGDDVRPPVHQVMYAFWCHPGLAEALTWRAYPYDSDPAGTAIRSLVRPIRRARQSHPRRSCMTRGFAHPCTPEAPGRLLAPRSGARTRQCPGGGLTHSGQMTGRWGPANNVAISDGHGRSFLASTARWPS